MPRCTPLFVTDVQHIHYRRTSFTFPPATTPHLITARQITIPLLLPPPSDYGKTSYISSPATTPPLITEGQVTLPFMLQHPLITEGQVKVKPYCLSLGQIWPHTLVC